MMRADIEKDIEQRVAFIREVVASAGAAGIVYGNSGGKDSALVGILCKMACDNTVGVIMPCSSKRNYMEDKNDAEAVANHFNIETRLVDLTDVKNALIGAVEKVATMNVVADTNIAPRLRMTSLYAIAACENRIVAGTGNKSEGHMGYFTKWGDGAHDFNPIADMTVTQIYEYLEVLDAPRVIIEKAPSAGLFDGQTDEKEMGVTYKNIDLYLMGEEIPQEEVKIIESYYRRSIHKRAMPIVFKSNKQ